MRHVFKCLIEISTIKIPDNTDGKTALDYHQIKIDLTGAFNAEPLVDLTAYGVATKSIYARAEAPYYRSFKTALKTVLVRESVAQKLAEVNKLLAHYHVELLALDGFRPIKLQQELWDHFIQTARGTIPSACDEDLVKFAGQFCSDPRGYKEDDFRTWPVHNTGGAIDLTLRLTEDKQELFMGSIFDDADSISSTAYFENPALTSQSATEARRNRRLLYHAMLSAGFANYHHEWWHYDFGTQMWVMNGGHKCAAHYGRATDWKG